MHRLVAALVAAVLLLAPLAARPAESPEPGPVALAFVHHFSDDHLSGMLSRIGAGSEALRALAEFDSTTVVKVFNAQIDAAVRRYGDLWARNLALAWSPLLTDAEMTSLVEESADSPYADKYLANRDAAAARMAELSRDLFRKILGEVVTATVAELSPDTDAPAGEAAEAPAK